MEALKRKGMQLPLVGAQIPGPPVRASPRAQNLDPQPSPPRDHWVHQHQVEGGLCLQRPALYPQAPRVQFNRRRRRTMEMQAGSQLRQGEAAERDRSRKVPAFSPKIRWRSSPEAREVPQETVPAQIREGVRMRRVV
jgi:hypothetical protein